MYRRDNTLESKLLFMLNLCAIKLLHKPYHHMISEWYQRIGAKYDTRKRASNNDEVLSSCSSFKENGDLTNFFFSLLPNNMFFEVHVTFSEYTFYVCTVHIIAFNCKTNIWSIIYVMYMVDVGDVGMQMCRIEEQKNEKFC